MTTPCSEQVTNPCNCTCDTGIVDIVMDINDNVNAKALALDAAVMSATNSAAEAEAAATYINNYVNTTTYVKTYQNEVDGLADNDDGAKFVEINTTGDTSVVSATVNEIVSGVAVPISQMASKEYVDNLGNLSETTTVVGVPGSSKVWSPILKVKTDSTNKDGVLNSQALALFNRTEFLKSRSDRSIAYFTDKLTAQLVSSTAKFDNNQIVEIKQDSSFGGATSRYDVLNNQLINGRIAYNASSVEYNPTGVGVGSISITVADKLRQVINVLDFGADPTGVNDSTTAIQAAIDSVSAGTVVFPAGVFRISSNITMKPYVNMQGSQTTITSTDPLPLDTAFFDSALEDNVGYVEVSGFLFKSNGIDDITTPFVNPYGGGQSVGYMNRMIGVRFRGTATGVSVHSCVFDGVNVGISLTGIRQFSVENNIGALVGESFVEITECMIGKIVSNSVLYALGGMTASNDLNTNNQPIANVINTVNSPFVQIENNSLLGCQGTAILSLGGEFVKIGNNNIILFSSSAHNYVGINCTGTGSKVSDNIIDGGLSNTGLYVVNGIVSHNIIKGCKYGAVFGSVTASHNTFNGSSYITGAVGVKMNSEGSVFTSNTVMGFGVTGLKVLADGVTITNNTFEDNGHNNVSIGVNSLYNSGMTIDSATQAKILVKHNRFISSSNSGTTTGQLSGIVVRQLIQGVNPFDNYPHNITENEFIFTGSMSAYPLNLNAYPCALTSYWDGTVSGDLIDNIGDGSNRSTKLKTTFAVGSPVGYHNVVGTSNTKPLFVGRKGDIVYSTNDVCIGWICTTNNSAVWTEFGSLKSSAAFTTANASVVRSLDVTGVTTAQLGNVLATLIQDLRTAKVIS